jgi:hypothetical protein
MDLFSRTCLDLGVHLLIKKGIDGIISPTEAAPEKLYLQRHH